MNHSITFRGLQRSQDLIEHTRRRLHASLSRFGSAIRRVEVRIGDLNGPRGGEDMFCRLTVSGPQLGTLSVHRSAEDPHAAVHLAAERMARAIGNRLERRRSRRRQAPSAEQLALAS